MKAALVIWVSIAVALVAATVGGPIAEGVYWTAAVIGSIALGVLVVSAIVAVAEGLVTIQRAADNLRDLLAIMERQERARERDAMLRVTR